MNMGHMIKKKDENNEFIENILYIPEIMELCTFRYNQEVVKAQR